MQLAPRSIVVLLAFASSAAMAAGAQPFEIVRELQVFQDQAALTTNNARAEQRGRITGVAAQLSNFDPGVWAEPRNARAAVVYVLSGGDPSVLSKLVKSGVTLAIDERLVKGALAYGERRDTEAAELLDGIDVDTLDRGIGGHVALVRALLVAKNDQHKAFALLDKARVLSPGTIVEEAALRRQAILAAKMGELDAFETLASQYFRRFGTSIFARSFEHLFAHEVVLRGYINNPKRSTNLETLLLGLPDAERRETCLALAEQAISNANVGAVRFAAKIAAIDAKAQPLDAIRMRLFEAAAVILTADYEEGSQALWTIDRSKLGVREEALLDAALSVAREIARAPSLPPQGASSEAEMGADPADAGNLSVINDAEQALARVDGLLSEKSR